MSSQLLKSGGWGGHLDVFPVSRYCLILEYSYAGFQGTKPRMQGTTLYKRMGSRKEKSMSENTINLLRSHNCKEQRLDT